MTSHILYYLIDLIFKINSSSIYLVFFISSIAEYKYLKLIIYYRMLSCSVFLTKIIYVIIYLSYFIYSA